MAATPNLKDLLNTEQVIIKSFVDTTLKSYLRKLYSNVEILSTNNYLPYSDLRTLNNLLLDGKLPDAVNFINKNTKMIKNVLSNYSWVSNFIDIYYSNLSNIHRHLLKYYPHAMLFPRPFHSFINYIISHDICNIFDLPQQQALNIKFEECFNAENPEEYYILDVPGKSSAPPSNGRKIAFTRAVRADLRPTQNEQDSMNQEVLNGVAEFLHNQCSTWNTVLDVILNMIKRDDIKEIKFSELLTLFTVTKPAEQYNTIDSDVQEYILLEKMCNIVSKVTLTYDPLDSGRKENILEKFNNSFSTIGSLLVNTRSLSLFLTWQLNIDHNYSTTAFFFEGNLRTRYAYHQFIHFTSLVGYYVYSKRTVLNYNNQQKNILVLKENIKKLEIDYSKIKNVHITLNPQLQTENGSLVVNPVCVPSESVRVIRVLLSVIFGDGYCTSKMVLGVPALVTQMERKLSPKIIGFIAYLHNIWGIWYPKHPKVINYCLEKGGFTPNNYSLLANVPAVKVFLNPSVESLSQVFSKINSAKYTSNLVHPVLELEGEVDSPNKYVLFNTSDTFIDMVDGRPIFNQPTDKPPISTDYGVFQVIIPQNNFITLLKTE